MITRNGDMWYSPADLRIFTGNATIKKNGALVMGRGAAKEALFRFPGCDKVFGDLITAPHATTDDAPRHYGLVLHPVLPLGIFQVKRHYSMPAELEIIAFSVKKLIEHCAQNPKLRVSMNFPGIGWGSLARADVLPLVERLPDAVTVWEY